jgi:hypothetical protein
VKGEIIELKNVLGESFAQMLHVLLTRGPGWEWGHGSNENGDSLFWYRHLEAESLPLLRFLTHKIKELVKERLHADATVLRAYANGQTSGLVAAPHHDDLQSDRWTFLYYPHTLQTIEGGETFFFHPDGSIRLVVPPRADTAVLFDSRILHSARAPTNAFKGLRVTVAYKLAVTPTAC